MVALKARPKRIYYGTSQSFSPWIDITMMKHISHITDLILSSMWIKNLYQLLSENHPTGLVRILHSYLAKLTIRVPQSAFQL